MTHTNAKDEMPEESLQRQRLAKEPLEEQLKYWKAYAEAWKELAFGDGSVPEAHNQGYQQGMIDAFRIDIEKLCKVMIANSLSTGHGDTFDELLKELNSQLPGELSRVLDTLKSDVVMDQLEYLAGQKLGKEMTMDEWTDADWESDYDSMVGGCRFILGILKMPSRADKPA